MAEHRALRNLREDITHAHQQLKLWRQDGDATKIAFWLRRRDELIDRFSAQQPAQPNESAQPNV